MTGPPTPETPEPPTAKLVIATGGSVAAGSITNLHWHQAPPPGVSWPIVVGQVPQAASAFQERRALRDQIDEVKTAGTGVLLTQVFSGGGGVGKSQLAASYAREAIRTGTDLVVWVHADQPDAIIDTFARAGREAQAPEADGENAETDARAFCEWASATHRPWLVVLDDINDPVHVAEWWPASLTGNGWVLATTRRRDASLTGSGRVMIEVGVYTPDEAHAYLARRLRDAGVAQFADHRGDELAKELGYLPLALSHAAAYMIDQQLTCADYLDRYTAGQQQLEELMPASADTDRYGRPVAVTMLLALDAADACDPAGLARPAMHLAGLLDPAGHPAPLWTSSAVTGYLTAARTAVVQHPAPEAVTPEQARSAVQVLRRFSLAIVDDQASARAIRVHALTARAAREATPARLTDLTARATADALTEIWPEVDQTTPALAEALRASTAILMRYAADAVWQPDGHSVIFRAGDSLLNAGLNAAAITYWKQITHRAEQTLAPEHLTILAARVGLATAYWQAGRTREAIAIEEQVVADRERILGPDHPDTLGSRRDLAASYSDAGRTDEAIAIEEEVADDYQRILGPKHHDTLVARTNLAVSYVHAGRNDEALAIFEAAAADLKRILGPEHPDTLTAISGLAGSYWQGGRTAEALDMFEQVTAIRERILGPEHRTTLAGRGNLAAAYRQAGRTEEAISIGEQVAAARSRVLGADHPETIFARLGLAASYRQAGRLGDAIATGEQVVKDRERILGADHPDTLVAGASLAASYRQAGRTADAVALGEQVTPEMTRILGAEHPETLAAGKELAASYRDAGLLGLDEND